VRVGWRCCGCEVGGAGGEGSNSSMHCRSACRLECQVLIETGRAAASWQRNNQTASPEV
jgi:hypothetical protein